MKYLEYFWHVVVFIAIIVFAVTIPIEYTFSLLNFELFILASKIISVIFIIDFLFNIVISLKQYNEFSRSFENNFPKYLRSWFLIDLIAAVPFLLFGNISFAYIQLVKILKLFAFENRLRKRFIKLSNFLRLFFFTILSLIFVHWLSCFWLVIRGVDLQLNKLSTYINSLYWTITTITTVGFGDITPITDNEKIFSIFLMIIGVGFYGYLIGNIANLLSGRDVFRDQYLDQLENLNSLVTHRKLPYNLQHKLRNYYTYIYSKNLGYNESEILDKLPDSLKKELSLVLKKDIIDKIDLFKIKDENFRKEISLFLEPMVVTPGDHIFEIGEEGNEMYFVLHGILDVIDENNKILAKLSGGDFFGEIALFTNAPRNATVKAEGYCELYILHRKAFDLVVNKYDGIYEKIKSKVEDRRRS